MTTYTIPDPLRLNPVPEGDDRDDIIESITKTGIPTVGHVKYCIL